MEANWRRAAKCAGSAATWASAARFVRDRALPVVSACAVEGVACDVKREALPPCVRNDELAARFIRVAEKREALPACVLLKRETRALLECETLPA